MLRGGKRRTSLNEDICVHNVGTRGGGGRTIYVNMYIYIYANIYANIYIYIYANIYIYMHIYICKYIYIYIYLKKRPTKVGGNVGRGMRARFPEASRDTWSSGNEGSAPPWDPAAGRTHLQKLL